MLKRLCHLHWTLCKLFLEKKMPLKIRIFEYKFHRIEIYCEEITNQIVIYLHFVRQRWWISLSAGWCFFMRRNWAAFDTSHQVLLSLFVSSYTMPCIEILYFVNKLWHFQFWCCSMITATSAPLVYSHEIIIHLYFQIGNYKQIQIQILLFSWSKLFKLQNEICEKTQKKNLNWKSIAV